MPRLIVILNEGEPCELHGMKLTASYVPSNRRRIRVVLDMPPQLLATKDCHNRSGIDRRTDSNSSSQDASHH